VPAIMSGHQHQQLDSAGKERAAVSWWSNSTSFGGWQALLPPHHHHRTCLVPSQTSSALGTKPHSVSVTTHHLLRSCNPLTPVHREGFPPVPASDPGSGRLLTIRSHHFGSHEFTNHYPIRKANNIAIPPCRAFCHHPCRPGPSFLPLPYLALAPRGCSSVLTPRTVCLFVRGDRTLRLTWTRLDSTRELCSVRRHTHTHQTSRPPASTSRNIQAGCLWSHPDTTP
jgi:hypothetical protein